MEALLRVFFFGFSFMSDYLHSDSIEGAVVDDHDSEDDIDYEALKRDTPWEWVIPEDF